MLDLSRCRVRGMWYGAKVPNTVLCLMTIAAVVSMVSRFVSMVSLN